MASETVRYMRIKVTIEGLVDGADGAALAVNEKYEYVFGDGTGTNQIGWAWQDKDGSLASTTATVDMDGATNFAGAAMSDNVSAKVLCFKHESDAGLLKVGGGDFSSFLGDASDKVVIGPRGLFLLVAPDGYAITASTGDGLLLETTATVSYRGVMAGDNT